MSKDDIDRLNVFPPDGGGENENDETDENELGERENCAPILDASSPRGSHNHMGGNNEKDNLPGGSDSPRGESPLYALGEVVQGGSGEREEKAEKGEREENAINAENTASTANMDGTLNSDEAKRGAPHPAEGMESAPLHCSINTVATADSGENNTRESPPTGTQNCSNPISCISTTRNHNTDEHVEMVEQTLECVPLVGEEKEATFAPETDVESKREEAILLKPNSANSCVAVACIEESPAVGDYSREVAAVVGEAASCIVDGILNEVANDSASRGEELLSLAHTVSSFQAELLEKNKGTFEEVKKRGLLIVLAIKQSFKNKTEKVLCSRCSPAWASLNGAQELFRVILKLLVEKETSELYLAHFLEKLKRDVEGANRTAQRRWAQQVVERLTERLSERLVERLTARLTKQVAKHVEREAAHRTAEAQLQISSLSKDRTTIMDAIKKWEEHFHQMRSEQEILHAKVKISVQTSFLNFTEYTVHLLLKIHSALCQKSDKLAFLINRLKCIGLDWRASQGGKGKGKRQRRGGEPRAEAHHGEGKIPRGKKGEKQKRKKRAAGRSKTGVRRGRSNRSERSCRSERSSGGEGCTSSLGGSSPPRSGSSSMSKSGNHHSRSTSPRSTSSCGSSVCLSNELCLSDLTHMNSKGLTDGGGKKKGRKKVRQLLIRASASKEGKNRARSVDNAGKTPPNKGRRKPRHRDEQFERFERRDRHDHPQQRKLYSRYRRYKRLYAEELQKNKTLHFLLTNKDEEIAQVRSALREEMQSRLFIHEEEEKRKLKEINELKGLLQNEEVANKKLAIRNEQMEEQNKSLKKKNDLYECTEKELKNQLSELNIALTKERRKNKRLASQKGKLKSALLRYNHGVNLLDGGRYRRDGKWCVNVSPVECVDGEMGSEADSSVGSEEDSIVGSEDNSEGSERFYEDEMYAPLGTVKVADQFTKRQRGKLLMQGRINKVHGRPRNNRGEDPYGRHHQQNEYKHVKLNSLCFSDNSVDVRMPRSRHLPRGGGTKGEPSVREKGIRREGQHQTGRQTGKQTGKQHGDPPLHIADQIRRDLKNFDETKYKKVISDITKEEKVIEKIKEDDLYSIFMQNWEESHMGVEEGANNGPLSWSGSFMHHLNRSILCANQGEGIPPGGNYEQLERGVNNEAKRGDFTEGSYANAVDNCQDDLTYGVNPLRENPVGMATQREATLMGHPGGHKNVTLSYDPKCAGGMDAFPVEETQMASGADLPRGEPQQQQQPHEEERNNGVVTSNGMNNPVGKGLGGAIGGASTLDAQHGNGGSERHGTNHTEGGEANQLTTTPQGETTNEGILKNYETYKKNKDKFIHLTLRKQVIHVGNERTPAGGGGRGGKKNTSLANVINKEISKRESKNGFPAYAEEEEAFEMERNYAPFQSAQGGNTLDKDRDLRESIMMRYTYGSDTHRGVTLQSNMHEGTHLERILYDQTDAHFFQPSEKREGSVVGEAAGQDGERGAHEPNGEGERVDPIRIARNPHRDELGLHNVSSNVVSTSRTSYPPVGGGISREKNLPPNGDDITAPPCEGPNGESHRGNNAAHSPHSLSMLMGATRKDKTGCRLITPDAPNKGTPSYAATHLVKIDSNAAELCPPPSLEEHNRPHTAAAKLNERNGSGSPMGIPPIEENSRGAVNETLNYSHQKGGHPWDNKISAGGYDPKGEALNAALGPHQTGAAASAAVSAAVSAALPAALPKRDSCEGASPRKSVGDRGVLSRLLRKK
ncbi:hypothetical protein PVMG_03118 [Plasmodium vivax Mauritania I]|uniref:Uncharacterized protein n=1 Tax=Plasmodium vivax Mauritania I TaxID=1035515 RepID=A0A0J9TFS8_PLAVI|nr:hypothetical protein PVMG_03118 [Plasmodium vivax Mauritania I]